ncbi:sortase [Patescibacteria group bacterium]|nr:sortase [Patescibacteria group bacterium]MBU1683334.1 sortase [Patescibacteria group bacterium]MBU1934598.1 sortase [Patescibacteria group bacterium]
MKAIIRFITIAVVLSLLFPNVSFAKSYSDVPYAHKYNESINTLSNQNIINGYENGEFHPEGNINRAEAVKILVEALYDDNAINNSLDWHKKLNHKYVMFPDVGINEWYGSYVEVAYQNNIIQGFSDNTFKPSNNLNFAEALKIILESHGVNLNVDYQENPLLYINRSDWYTPYFSYAYEYNLINQNKFYHPAQLITRGEFAEIVYRLQTVQETGLPEFVASSLPTSDEYKITIPELDIINLNVNFADPDDERAALDVLKYGLGHYLYPPDNGKKTVVFGHSSGYSWDNSPYKTILRQIDNLSNGDKIYINYKEKGYVYEIFSSDIIPATEDYRIVENQLNNELALYTCWPPDRIDYRYVVYGKPIS